MAIAGIPTNFNVQTANGQVFVSSALTTGALSYSIQRSIDGVTYVTVATPTSPQYLDTTVLLGVQYYYQMASVNGSGTSPYTTAQSVVPTTSGEMSLGAIRLQSQQRADRVNSNFITTSEWNIYINQAMFELYDLLTTTFEDYFLAPSASFIADGSTFLYPLPNGVLTFTGPNGSPIVAAPFYKLAGVDLALNNAANAYVTVNKFNFSSRNAFVYPNTASTIYGVFNLEYRLMGSNIEFIPTPSASQTIRLWYQPRLQMLLQDTDVTTMGISGWIEYVIVRAAKYALDKEESDTSKLDQQLLFVKQRIEESAANRDAGMPNTISNTRAGNWADGWWGGTNGAIGGW